MVNAQSQLEASCVRNYTVQPGDSCYKISAANNVSMYAKSPYLIHAHVWPDWTWQPQWGIDQRIQRQSLRQSAPWQSKSSSIPVHNPFSLHPIFFFFCFRYFVLKLMYFVPIVEVIFTARSEYRVSTSVIKFRLQLYISSSWFCYISVCTNAYLCTAVPWVPRFMSWYANYRAVQSTPAWL